MANLNFPTSPNDGDTYEGYVYNAAKGVWQWQVVDPSVASLVDTNIENPAAGEKLVYDGTEWVNLEAYAFVETVYFESNGTFSKGDYPWLRAVRVKCVGGGGGGGGVNDTTATTTGAASGGQGGVYGEVFVTNIVGLASEESITVGSGGSGGAAGANDGFPGGSSSFGSILIVDGGKEGLGVTASTPARIRTAHAGNDGATGADFSFKGRPGGAGFALDGYFQPGNGGYSFLAPDSTQTLGGSNNSRNGPAGVGFGAGGSGGGNGFDQTAVFGGNGADGVVIVELFA